MSPSDSALEWFTTDAKRQGMTIRQYEAAYGLTLMPAQHRIAAHESPESALADGWEHHIIGVVGGSDETTAPSAEAVVVVSEDAAA